MARVLYEIVVKGPVGSTVVAALDGFEVVSCQKGSTILRGWIIDQSGLHGVLDRIFRFGLELASAAPVED